MNKPYKTLSLALFLLLAFGGCAFSQIMLCPGTTSYSQNFDNLPSTRDASSGGSSWTFTNNTTIPGWYAFTTSRTRTDDGSWNTAGLYSYGVNNVSDRALGSLSSSTNIASYGAIFQNQTGQTLTSVTLAFRVEQWREATTGASPQQNPCQIYTSATNPSGTIAASGGAAGAPWAANTSLDMVPFHLGASATGAGNTSVVNVSVTLTVSIPNGSYFAIRWYDPDSPSNDQGLAIDDFSITYPNTSTALPTPTAGSNTPVCQGTALNLTGSSTLSGITWYWTGPSGFTSTSQNPTIASAAASNAGVYSLVVIQNGCTTSAATASVTVNAAPANPPSPTGNAVGCTATTLSEAAAPAGITYYWEGTSSSGTSTANPASSTYNVTTDGTYYVRAQNNATGCWSTGNGSLTVDILSNNGLHGFWTGLAADGDWSNCLNWNDGQVPSALDDVNIPAAPATTPQNVPDGTVLTNLILNNAQGMRLAASGTSGLTLATGLSLTNGKLDANGNFVLVANNAAGAVSGGSSSSYIYNGALYRDVTGGAGTVYKYPVGDATRYRRLDFTIQTTLAVTGFDDEVGVTFNTGTHSPAFSSPFTEQYANFQDAWNVGYWTLDPLDLSGQLSTAMYDVEVFPNWTTSNWCTGSASCLAYTQIKYDALGYDNGSSQPVNTGSYNTNGGYRSNGISASGGIKRTGYTSFSDILVVGSGVTPFPVEMLSFEARFASADVLLNWNTASEQNNRGFEVQRAADGGAFQSIGFVAAKGTAKASYDFRDPAPAGTTFFYRLRQVDLNGQAQYSNVVELTRTPAGAPALTFYPNPTEGGLSLRLEGTDASARLSLAVYTLDGRCVLTAEGTAGEVSAQLMNSFSGLSKGVYAMRTQVEGQTLTSRIVKN